MIAVADGVGGWASKGVDPGLFSKQLCRDLEKIYYENPDESLKNILVEAVKKNKNVGSSTALLAKLDQHQPDIMKTTNLGDCAYLLLRVAEQRG